MAYRKRRFPMFRGDESFFESVLLRWKRWACQYCTFQTVFDITILRIPVQNGRFKREFWLSTHDLFVWIQSSGSFGLNRYHSKKKSLFQLQLKISEFWPPRFCFFCSRFIRELFTLECADALRHWVLGERHVELKLRRVGCQRHVLANFFYYHLLLERHDVYRYVIEQRCPLISHALNKTFYSSLSRCSVRYLRIQKEVNLFLNYAFKPK